MRSTFAKVALISTLLLASAHYGCAQARTTAAQSAPAGWTTHNDPMGFTIDVPPGWNLSTDAKQGRIALRGTRGEQAVVWPMSIEQQGLDSRGAGALLAQLARKVDGEILWSAPSGVAGGAVRAIGRGPQLVGSAVITWSASSNGTTVMFYCVDAPAEIYRGSTDTFATILHSFRVVPAPASAAPKPASATSGPPTNYVSWSDPHENAFTISVPQGWQTVGGSYRLAATDVRVGVITASPDGQIRVIFGDSNLGTFIEPNPMMTYAGLREGNYYQLGDGSRLLIQRYLSGQQAARMYVQTYVTRQCTGLQAESNNVRDDLAPRFQGAARSEGMPNAQLTAGDISFTCTINGTAVRGSYVLATVRPLPGQSGIWYVYRLYGYLAAPDRVKEAEAVRQRSLDSLRINPEWVAQQQQIANAAVAEDNARSQQIQARARQAIQDDQRETSDIIMKGWEQRSQVYDEISRRRENAILGTVDVVDPASGTQYKIDNYSGYHWMNNEGTIAGNNTGDAPGPDWHELVTLP